MKKFYFYHIVLFILLGLSSIQSFAWDHSLSLGYGFSHDPNNVKYNNSGFLLSGDVYPIKRTCSTFWSINAALGQWHSSAPRNKNTTTAALSLALRYYLFNFATGYPSYLLASVGPAYLSKQRLGTNTQGSHASIQTNLGVGAELRKVDVNVRLVHYSNAGLAYPNHGFNVLYLASIGYLF